MAFSINLNPSHTTFYAQGFSKAEVHKKLKKVVAWDKRMGCLGGCIHEVAKVGYDTGLSIQKTAVFGFNSIVFFLIKTKILPTPKYEIKCLQSGKDLGVQLLRLAVRVVQSTITFFGNLAGFLLHPIIGTWIEQQTNHLDRLKLIQLPEKLERLFKNNPHADYSADNFTSPYLPKATESESEDLGPTIPADEMDANQKPTGYYVPDIRDHGDPYRVLGLPKTKWNTSDIKKRFHKLALIYHPDKTTDEELKKKHEALFKIIHEAFELLKDAKHHPIPLKSQAPKKKFGTKAQIVMPSLELTGLRFMMESEKTLYAILVNRETGKIHLGEALKKLNEFVLVLKAYQDKTPKLQPEIVKRLAEFKTITEAYCRLSKDFTITKELQIEAKMKPDPVVVMITKLKTLGEEIMPILLSIPKRSLAATAESFLGLRYFDKMNALYILLVRYGSEAKKPYKSHTFLEEYRKKIGVDFYIFYQARARYLDGVILQNNPQAEPLRSLMKNAVGNFSSMVTFLNQIVYALKT